MRAFFSHTLAVLLVLAAAWLAPDAAYAQSAGASLLLDGTDDYMTVTSNTTLDVTTAYTLEAWVYPTGTFDPNNEATRAHILSRWGIGGAGNAAYMLGLLGNGKVRAANHDGTTTAGVNSTVALTTGQWNHIASTFANGTLAIYINGVQQGQATGIVPPQVSTHYDFNIGRESNGGKYFQGRVDEARIWNAALTQAEIQANQNRRLSGGERAGALVGYWPFDAGTTTTVDLAGNDNTGTLTNGASIDAAVASAFTAGPPSTVAGNALTLNGTDEYVALGSFSLPESFTFEMWVNPTSTDDGQAFFGKHATSGTNQFLAGYYNGAFTVNIRGDEHVAGTKITGWHHLAVVVNKTSATASDVTVYRNGTELWQTPLADVLGAADGLPWLVGMDYDGGPSASDHLNGQIDEVRVWRSARAIGEIRQTMNHSLTGTEADLVGYWQFNDATPGATASEPIAGLEATLVNMNASNWTPSEIPLGLGTTAIETPAVGNPAAQTFGTTGVTVDFSANAAAEAIGVTRLDVATLNPPALTEGGFLPASTSWAMQRHGSGAFTADLTFNIGTTPIAASGYRLYRRPLGSTTPGDWVDLGASSQIDANNQTVTFTGVQAFGQFVISSIPPALVATAPADDASGVPAYPVYQLTFDRTMTKGTGDIVVKTSGGTEVERIDVASSAVTINNATVTVTPATPLTFSTDYAIEIDSSALVGAGGLGWEGIADLTTWSFSTVAPPATARGNALAFNGSTDYITANTIPAALANADGITVETWFKPAATASGNDALMAFNTASGGNHHLLFFDATTGVLTHTHTGNSDVDGTTTMVADQWYHVALAIDAQDGTTVYLNGKPEIRRPDATTRPDATDQFSIGQEYDASSPTNYFEGEMDEVRVWRTARRQDELLATMHGVLSGRETNLVAYWQLDTAGSSIFDHTGGHTGTVAGSPSSVASTRPFGLTAGATEQPGTLAFPGTNLSLNMLLAGSGTLYATLVEDAVANVAGSTGALQDRYWMLHRAGSGPLNTVATFTLPANTVSASDVAAPSQFRLYYTTGFDGTWTEIASASSASSANQTLVFEGVRQNGRYAIVRQAVLGENVLAASDGLEDRVDVTWTGDDLDAAAALLTLKRAPTTVLLDGADDYITASNLPPALGSASALTVEAWFKPDPAATGKDAIVAFNTTDGSDSGNRHLVFFDADTRALQHTLATTDTPGTTTLSPGQWHHVALVVDAQDGTTVYLDGQQEIRLPATTSLIGATDLFSVGQEYDGGGSTPSNFFHGEIDEVRIWSVARSEQQIRSAMPQPLPSDDRTGLIAYWPFDGSGATVTDEMGTANGTLVGATRPTPTTLAVMAAEATSYTDTTVDPQRTYRYCLELSDNAGTVINDACDLGRRPLTSPIAVEASNAAHLDKVVFTWNDRSAVESGYHVFRQRFGSDQLPVADEREWLTEGAPLAANTERYEDTSAVAGPNYQYCVVPFVDSAAGPVLGEARCAFGSRAQVLPPLNVAASDGQFGDGTRITWTSASTTDTYEITRDGTLIASPAAVAEGETGSYTDTGATSGTTHTYAVRTVGSSSSVYVSDEGGVGILPAPGDLTATNGTFDDRVVISWTDPFADPDAYQPAYAEDTRQFKVYRKIAPEAMSADTLHTAGAGETSFTDQTADGGVTYTYCVHTVSTASGSAVASAAVCTTGLRRSVLAVDNVTATDGTLEDRTTITWTASATTVNLFKIYRDDTLIKTVVDTTRSYDDLGTASDVEHTYCVSAVTADGSESEYGSGIDGTCDTGARSLSSPTDVVASDDAQEASVIITWVDNSAVEVGYRVYRRLASEAASANVLIGTTATSRSTFTDETGVPGNTYLYSIAPFDVQGEGTAVSDEGRRTLLAPTDVTASNGTSETRITLTWTDNSVAEDGYRIQRRLTSAPADPFVTVGETAARSASYADDSSLAPGQSYTYQVVAYDAHGTSAPVEVTGTTVLLPPSSFNASTTYDDRVELVWVDASDHNTSYALYRKLPLAADSTLLKNDFAANATNYTDGTAVAGETYVYTLVSVAGDLTSTPATAQGERYRDAPITIVPGDVVDLENPFETPSPRTDGRMGSGLAIEGDYAFAGAGGCNTNNQSEAADAGEGYIFRRNLTANQWEYVSTVQPINPIAKQGFGGVADLSGNYLIVGNCRHLENTSASASDVAAYIFKGNGDTWTQHAKLDNASATKAFGAAVAIDGDYAVVGDYLYDGESGWIHLYKRNGDTWTLVESLDGSINDATDFGRAVAIDDGYVAVGMKEAYGSGGVSVYPIGDDGFGAEVSLTPFDYNLANDTQNMDFGHAVALSGRWLLVGADDADDDRGAAFIFYRNDDGSWSRRQKLQPDNLQDNSGGAGTGDDFGWSVGINDDVAIIGVPDRDTFRGQVYLYRYNGEAWVEQQQLIASDRVPNDKFGYAVAIDQARAVIGVPQRTVGSNAEAGAIFINEVVSAPDAVAASDGTLSNRVQVNWTDDAINEEKYLIYRDGALLQEVGANATSYNDTGASAGTVHRYCVAAFNERDGASAQVCDPGWRPADGAISGRIASQQGAGIQGVDVCAVPSADSPLAAGGALLFDGLGSGIVVGNEAAYDFSSTPGYTLELWINAAEENFAEHAPYHLISQWGSGGAGRAAYVLALREDLNVSISNHTGSTNHSVNSGALITPGEWVHVAGTFDSATNELRIYINGVLQGTTTDASAPQRSDIYDLMFGVEPSGGNEFRGLMDEIRIWNVARTEAQIMAAMKVPLTGDEANLVGYWPIQQGGGNVVGNFTQNGLHGTAKPGVYWTSEAAPLNDCTATDSDGNYQLQRIRYGEQTAFQVTPTDAIRQFQPPVKSISLTTASPVQNEVNFTDVSAYTVSGVVQYAGTTVDGNAFTCPVEGVQMLLDGVFRSESEADGAFAVPAGLGTRTLTAELETQAENGDVTVVHSFTPAQHTLDVQGDLFNINFVDDTRRQLVLNVQGGCGHSIGTATVRVTTANSCFTSDVSLSSGTPTVLALPPQAYQVQVLDVQDVPAGLDRADILAFFDALGVQEIDLTATPTNAPDTLTLTYRAPATLSISGFEAKDQLLESTCAAGAPLSVLDDKGSLLQTLPHVPVLFGQSGETTQPIPMTIKLVEQYGTESCAVEGVTVSVLDQINDQGTPIELITNAEGIAVYQEDQTLPNNIAGPSAGDLYQTYANTSNVTEGLVVDGVNRSFQKALTASVNIEGRDQLSKTAWAVVLGRRTRTGTFSTLPTIDVPLHVLRDPPGDASFSYLTKGESVCQNYGFEGAFTLSGATDLKIETGLEFEAGFFGFTTETDVEVSPGFEHSLSGTITSGGTWETCLTLGSTISTSDAATFIGEAADVFVGVGTNFKLALSDKLEATDACEIELSEVASVGFDEAKAFETVYTYTRGQIENTVIPTLEGLKATDSDHANQYQDGIDSWEAQLAYDEIEKKAVANACSDLEGTLRNQPKTAICANLIAATNTTLDALQTDVMKQCTTNLGGDDSETTSACEGLVDPVLDQLRNNLSTDAQKENRSFDAGASYSYTHTRDRITTFDFGVEVEFSNVWKYNVKSKAAGNGGELETSIGVTLSPSFSYNRTWSESHEVGYTLADSDIGDYFSVDVYDDFNFTTPIFDLVSGRSSNPWEPNWTPTDKADSTWSAGDCFLGSKLCEANTQPRDNPRLAVTGPITQTGVAPDEPATFTLALSNLSDSNEQREYHIRSISTSNPGGAVLKAQGASIHNGLSFFMDPNTTQEITLQVERGPSRYRYDSLQVMVYPPGEYANWEDGGALQLADTVLFSVHFEAPCSAISLRRPLERWTYGASDASLDLLAEGLDLNSPDLAVDRVGFQYRREGQSTWQPIMTLAYVAFADLDAADKPNFPNGMYTGTAPNGDTVKLDPTKTSIETAWTPPANTNGGNNDGAYEVRGFTDCGGDNTVVSDAVLGTVDRVGPALFGLPEPADGVLHIGDEIAVTFDEAIACGSVVTSGNGQNVFLTAPDGSDADTDPDALAIEAACDGSTVILTPQADLSAYENQDLTVTLTGGTNGLKDLLGNALPTILGGGDVAWTFTVNQSGFAFSPRNIEVDVTRGRETMVEVNLVNGRAQPVAFTLPASLSISQGEGAPATLTPSVQAGTLVANGQQRIRFTLPETLGLGTWKGSLSASGQIGNEALGDAPFTLTANVVCQPPPSWTVDAALFQHSMAVNGQLLVAGVASEDVNDRIVAMVNGEIRGLGQVQNTSLGYRVSMLVYSNSTSGEAVSFQVWDDSACTIHEDVTPAFLFAADEDFGSPTQPVAIHASPPANAQSIALNAGWTWFSVNTETSDTPPNPLSTVLADIAGASGDLIKPHGGNPTQYDRQFGWAGALTHLAVGEAYFIKLSQSQRLTLTGTPVDPTRAIDVTQDWNGIGYLPQETLAINSALGSAQLKTSSGQSAAQTGDLIKSQTAFAEYVDGVGWVGSLTELQPGGGYMLRLGNSACTNAQPCTISYPAAATGAMARIAETRLTQQTASLSTADVAEAILAEEQALESGQIPAKHMHSATDEPVSETDLWQVTPTDYPLSMTVVADLHRDGLPHGGEATVAALSGGTVVGVGHARYIEALDAYRVFLTVYSDGQSREPLQFNVYDPTTDFIYPDVAKVAFQANAHLGTVAEPFQLTYGLQVDTATDPEGETPTSFALQAAYPNPFNPMTTIPYTVPQRERVVLDVYDSLGRRVARLADGIHTAGTYTARFDATGLSSGIYFARMRAGSFSAVQRVLLLK